jgi:hypothetical protein
LRYFLLTLLFAIIAGCASKNIQQAATGEQSNNSIAIGYSTDFGRAIATNDGKGLIFFRIQFTDGAFSVTEIAPSILRPNSSTEEVLAYTRNGRMIGPAYETNDGFTDGSGFVCSAWSSKLKSKYHPCGTGSRFVSVNKANSTFRNIVVTPLTWGLGAGMNYEIDFDNLTKIVDQLQLTTLGNRAWQSVELVNKLNNNLKNIASNASTNAATNINVINNTGFPTPKLPRTIANVSLSHTQQVAGISSVLYDGDLGVFSQIDAKSNAQFENIKNSGKFNVSCLNSGINVSGFSGSITCPKSFNYIEPKDTLELTYKLDSYSTGTRFPAISGHDKSLSLKVEGGEISLVNQTNTYVEVKSITIYGGKEVVDTKLDLSFAPMSSNKTPYFVKDYAGSSITQMFTFNRIKAVDIAGKNRLFGVAIKYRVGNGGNFETLFIKRDVPLSSLM